MIPIPYGKQFINDDDIAAVVSVLKSDFLTQGPKIAAFETQFAEYIGCRYAVAVANGTAALHLSAMAVNVRPGQKVITTPITFAASANCVEYCGGTVHFVDIDPETYLLDIDSLNRLLKSSSAGTYSGIIPVDFGGRAVDLEQLKKIADKYGLWIIEDACHAPGGFFTDGGGVKQLCGNGFFADLSIFSFHPVKHIACGEGGMITTNNEALYKRLMTIRTHGITRDSDRFSNDKAWARGNADTITDKYPAWYMEMQELGYNYRLTDFQAALGISQLKRADAALNRRRDIAEKYSNAFRGKDWLRGQSGLVGGHAYHLYIIEVDDRLGLYEYLRTKNIFSQVHYIPVHLMPYYRKQGFKENDFPNAENYYSRCLSLPMYPTLSDEDLEFVIGRVTEYYN